MMLYDSELLPECYAVRLLVALLDVSIEVKHVDCYPGQEHREAAFLAINPAGTLPVLVTERSVICDWQGALAYLAMRHDSSATWWPAAAEKMAGVQEWLGVARLLQLSAGLARLHDAIGLPSDVDAARRKAHALLRQLDRHLWFAERAGEHWLLTGRAPSVADLAVFVQVVVCEEGGIERMNYPAVRRWIDRFRRMPGFVAMGGVFSLPPLDAGPAICS